MRRAPISTAIAARGRDLRPAHAERAHASRCGVRAVAARIHGALGDHPGAGARRPDRDAPGTDESRRRDRPAGCRLRGVADQRAGAGRAHGAHGGALRPAHERPCRGWPRAGGGMAAFETQMLFAPERPLDSLTIRGAAGDRSRLRRRRGARRDDREGGHHAARAAGAASGALVLAPAFVDPHVHLRTPGREDEETIASGTAAAAAGGYCAILAMPNTDPVVDSAAVLGSLIETAREEAVVPVGFMAAISKGLRGEELTEMAELAALGAAGFTDDGRPVVAAGLLQRALAVQRRHRPAAVAARGRAVHLAGRADARRGCVGGARVSPAGPRSPSRR